MTERSVKNMCALIVDREKKKEDIILAALKMFSEKGFLRTTIKDIAEQAGIGKGTVYEYFKDKEEIIQSSFFYFQRFLEVDMEKILLSDKNGALKLSDLIKAILKVLNNKEGNYLDLMFDFWAEGMKGNKKGIMLTEMKRFYDIYRKMIEDIIIEGIKDGSIREDIDPFETASILIGAMDGIMVQWILDRKTINTKRIEKNLIYLVLNGIKIDKNRREGPK